MRSSTPHLFIGSDPRNPWLTFDRAAFMRCGVVPVIQNWPIPRERLINSTPPSCRRVLLHLDQRPRTGQRVQNIPTIPLINVRMKKKKKNHCSTARKLFRTQSNHVVLPFILMGDCFQWRQIIIYCATNLLDTALIATTSIKRLYSALNVNSRVMLAYCSPYTT